MKDKKRKAPTPPAPSQVRFRHPVSFYFYILAFLLTYFLYKSAVDNYFYNDDFFWVAMARNDMDAGNILTFRVIGFFRPLVNLSFFLTEKIAPGSVAVYHYTSILLHFFNSVLVFHLLDVLFRRRSLAFAAALYFVITSTHTGAVFWISARTTLLSSLFLLSSLVCLLRASGSARGLIVPVALYVLALMAKETAVTGVLLAALMFFYLGDKIAADFRKKALSSYAAVTLLYLVIRWVAIGTFTQTNWGPGAHAFGNLTGGFLFLFLPWFLDPVVAEIAKLLFGAASKFWVELLALPLAALLVYAGAKKHKKKEMLFAVLWIAVCLLPASFFKFRFLSQNSFAHDRYYYLASVGSCLIIVMLLNMLWNSGRLRVAARAVTVVIVLAVAAGDSLRVRLLEMKWDQMSGDIKNTVTAVEKSLDQLGEFDACAIEGQPVPYRYLKYALLMERPRWRLVPVEGGPHAAREHAPCVYIRFTRKGTDYEVSTFKIH